MSLTMPDRLLQDALEVTAQEPGQRCAQRHRSRRQKYAQAMGNEKGRASSSYTCSTLVLKVIRTPFHRSTQIECISEASNETMAPPYIQDVRLSSPQLGSMHAHRRFKGIESPRMVMLWITPLSQANRIHSYESLRYCHTIKGWNPVFSRIDDGTRPEYANTR
jgi:hypothetical protein